MERDSLGRRHKSVPNLVTLLCLFCEQINWFYSLRSTILPNSFHVLFDWDEIKWKILGLYFWDHFQFEMSWLMSWVKSFLFFAFLIMEHDLDTINTLPMPSLPQKSQFCNKSRFEPEGFASLSSWMI